MESQPQNPEFRNNSENFGPCQYGCGSFRILSFRFFGTGYKCILNTKRQQQTITYTVLFYKLYNSYQT